MFDIFSFLHPKPRNRKVQPVILLVLDGWGIAPVSQGNAIAQAKTPVLDRLKEVYPYSQLIASGESVGLPANEEGNTEVGHLTLGAGRVIFQDLKRINNSIFDRSFYDNQALRKAVDWSKKNNSKLHLVGLIGSGNVHASNQHLYALLQFCRMNDVSSNVYLHLFTDGRDSPPQDAKEVLKQVEAQMHTFQVGRIATLAGRYYAMDRDGRWERTEKAYRAIVEGVGASAETPLQALEKAYQKNITDEFLEPTIITPSGKIENNDAVIFYNFRIDRPRQLTMAFLLQNFESLRSFEFDYVSDTERVDKMIFEHTFQRNVKLSNLFFVTMTDYQKNLPVNAIAFPPGVVTDGLPEILSKSGMLQMHMAESEKERFVRFYFDGMHDQPFAGEEAKIVPSPKVATYDKLPQMSLGPLVSEFKRALTQDKYHFFVINFANPDMVAHTGNIQATIKALEFTDQAIGEIAKAVLEANGYLFVTADHGNAEELLSFPTQSFFFTTHEGSINTDHSNNPVPLIVVANKFERKTAKLANGSLSDVAPTILGIMNIGQPAGMTGKNLFFA